LRPPCEVIAREFLSLLRTQLAVELRRRGFRQRDIASILGVSQPVVSNMLSSYGDQPIPEDVKRRADMVEKGVRAHELVRVVCRMCSARKRAGAFCAAHMRKYRILPPDCEVCWTVEEAEGSIAEAANDLRTAIGIVESSSADLIALYPEVGINIVRAFGEGLSPDEMLAVPGRIVRYKGRLKAFSGPEVGVSTHNGAILSIVRSFDRSKKALMNLKWIDGLERNLERIAGDFLVIVRDSDVDPAMRDEELFSKIRSALQERVPVGAIVDPGAFGVEPSLYLLAPSAVEVARMAVALAKNFTGVSGEV